MGSPPCAEARWLSQALSPARCGAGAGLQPLELPVALQLQKHAQPVTGAAGGSAARDFAEVAALHMERSMAGFLSEVCFPGETTTI